MGENTTLSGSGIVLASLWQESRLSRRLDLAYYGISELTMIGLSIRDDLEGRFYGMPFIDDDGRETWNPVEEIGKAEGLFFLCPTCYVANGNTNVGTHRVMCWSPNVPQRFAPNPGRWRLVGTGLEDVSLVKDSSSVAIRGDCKAHFFVTNGRISDRKLE